MPSPQEAGPEGERVLVLSLREAVVLHAIVSDALDRRMVHAENWRNAARIKAKMEQFITLQE